MADSSKSISQAVRDICEYARSQAIAKVLPLHEISGLSAEKQCEILEWHVRKHEALVREGEGRQPLVSRFPEYANPDQIPVKLKELYRRDPREAGRFAERYIGINPATSVFPYYDFPDQEEFLQDVALPGTTITIRGQADLEDIDGGFYEFKLTNKQRHECTLRRALVQLYLYDFLYRLRFGIDHYKGMIIDLCIIDDEMIYRYYPAEQFGERLVDYQRYCKEIVKPTLKAVFSTCTPQDAEKIGILLDEVYDAIRPALMEDHNQTIARHIATRGTEHKK
jgi:hypothetical protein